MRDGLGLQGVDATFAGGSALAAGLAFQAAWELPSVAPNWFVWEPLLRRIYAAPPPQDGACYFFVLQKRTT